MKPVLINHYFESSDIVAKNILAPYLTSLFPIKIDDLLDRLEESGSVSDSISVLILIR